MAEAGVGAWRVVLAGLLLLAGGQLAAQSAHLEAYRAYQSAFQAGNVAEALTQGARAWELAEQELGDHATTAVLAYNYARLAFPFAAHAERAVQAYERALALTERGIGGLDGNLVRIGLAELRLITRSHGPTASGDLLALLRDRQAAGGGATDVTAHAWKTLAGEHLRQSLWSTATEYADLALVEAAALVPQDLDVLVDALMLGAMARLSQSPTLRTQQQVDEAVERLERVVSLYPAQTDIDSFDRRLAMALTWRASVATTGPAGRDAAQLSQLTEMIPMAVPGRPSNCPELAEVLEQTPMRFPEQAQGAVGAVLFGLDLGESGVQRVVILAEPQGGGFGAEVRRTVPTWKLKAPLPAGCEDNWVTFAFFAR